jgi:hypothetical protein
MVTNLSSHAKDAILESLKNHPAFLAAIHELQKHLPETMAEGIVDIESEIKALALAKLRENLDKMDTSKIVAAVLANEKLRGKIMVEVEDLGIGFSERLKADLREAIIHQTNLIRNLLTARREQARARRAELKQQHDELKQKRDTAKLQLDLAKMRFYKSSVAGPTFVTAFILGAIAMANYFPAIACDKKADVVCSIRFRPGTYPPP